MIFSRHYRFLLALLAGSAIFVVTTVLGLDGSRRVLLAANGFFAAYLGLILIFALKAKPDDLRRHAERSDEGLPLILVIATGAILVSVTALFEVLNAKDSPGAPDLWLALASLPLGWGMVHTVVALHYAFLFYAPVDKVGFAGGLAFPGSEEPDVWDFFYFAFGIAMCAQVADVTTESSRMRRVALAHAVASFFFNAVIVAVAVNAAVAFAG